MKKLIIFLVVFLLTVSSLLSQNRIDPRNIRAYTDTIVNFDDTNVFAKNWNDFIIGWNYGGKGSQFDQLMNFTHTIIIYVVNYDNKSKIQ